MTDGVGALIVSQLAISPCATLLEGLHVCPQFVGQALVAPQRFHGSPFVEFHLHSHPVGLSLLAGCLDLGLGYVVEEVVRLVPSHIEAFLPPLGVARSLEVRDPGDRVALGVNVVGDHRQ